MEKKLIYDIIDSCNASIKDTAKGFEELELYLIKQKECEQSDLHQMEQLEIYLSQMNSQLEIIKTKIIKDEQD